MVQKYTYLLPVLILCTVKQYAACKRAGYHYIVEEDAWLRLHNMPASWPDARLRCHLEGGMLASPTTSGLAAAMKARMAAGKLTMRSVFIGINAFISKGDYMSLDGTPASNITIPWANGEPNNLNNNEDCLVMTGAGEVADVSCSSVHPYFCRKESSKMTLNKCGTTDNEYKLEPRTGSCYKFHRLSRPWPRAAMACHAEGAHLAIINSHTESEALKDLYSKNPNSVIKGAGDANMAIVGFWDWKEHGEWLTVFGETLAEAGFEAWSPNEPNNRGGSEFCGSIKRDGLLNDLPCNIRAPFICEITP